MGNWSRQIGSDAKKLWMLTFWVDDVDALYAELKAKGAKILEEPVLRFYKCYELVVEDLNGYVLVFARDTATDRR